MKNICFIANYYKTHVFVEISKTLMLHNITSYWIVVNRKQYESLKKEIPSNQLLYIGKSEVLASNMSPIPYDLKVHELVYGDRVLREESTSWTFDYLFKLQPFVYQFIKNNNISYVFGEVTWAHELIIHRLTLQAKELNCEFLNPHTIRIPNGRFTFFTDEFQSKVRETSASTKSSTKIEIEKPDYLAINDKVIQKKGTISHNLRLLKNFILRTNQDINDPTLYKSPLTQFKIRTKEMYNRILFKNFVKEVQTDNLPLQPKILFTLHKQPEASVDVIGRYYENQLLLIKNIWRFMPDGYQLLVKEHSNAIGDRSLAFYRAVKQLRNTYLISCKSDSHQLLNNVVAVFTISGTIAYEAALIEKPAFTFAPTFFNKLCHCSEVSIEDFKHQTLERLITNTNSGMNINEFSSWLLENSFEGIMSDSFGDPRCMAENNIKLLSNAFLKIID